MEVKNRLLNFKEKVIYQNNEWFNFSLDSVLLVNFVRIKSEVKKILDIGTGNAPIPMLLTYKTNSKIDAVEIQKPIYELAKKSIDENKMNNQINLYNQDIKDFADTSKYDSYDIITCNPPYFPFSEKSNINESEIKTIARHDIKLKLDELINISSKLLKIGGKLTLVFRTERIIEIVELFKKNGIEPKRLQFVYPKMDKESNIVLVEGVKKGSKGLKVLKPLYIHNEDGSYRNEIVKMFGDDEK